MKNKVCECCFWTICMDNLYVLFTKRRVISTGSYESDCALLVMVVANAVKIFFQPSYESCCPRGHRLKRFVECLYDLRLSPS